ncbi:hypothetical protein GCM10010317_059990 [Streptomyces mirabilis]|nr:hypothetical protein GCM10010317_059990 [Streptomyces mirabilis]
MAQSAIRVTPGFRYGVARRPARKPPLPRSEARTAPERTPPHPRTSPDQPCRTLHKDLHKKEPSPGARGGKAPKLGSGESRRGGGECVGTRFWGVLGLRPGTLNPGP